LAAAEASPALERKRRQIPFYGLHLPYYAAAQRTADYVWKSVDADKDGKPDDLPVISYVAPSTPVMTYSVPTGPFHYFY
jgi:hypothetical protein